MEILNDNRKNLTGAALADSYREELELLDEQINALTQKQKLQKEEQKELQSQGRDISRDGKKVHIKSLSEQGVEFDDKGNITNYNEAIVNRTNEYNKMIESYNNLSADRQTDELKAQMDEAKKDYDQFVEDMERYETLTQDEMKETAKEIADALNKKIEKKIEKFSLTIDLKIETREAEQSLEDFKSKMEHRDKTAAGRTETAANKFKNYMDPDTGVQAEIDRVNKIKDDIEKMKNGGHSDVYSEYDEESGKWADNTKQAEEDLKKYTEQMMNDMEDMEDIGLIAYNHIGNKNPRLYRATLNVNCVDGSIELPCNVDIIEAVTYCGEDWNYTSNTKHNGDINSFYTENAIEA